MKYSDLLREYIQKSGLSLAEIALKLTPYGFNTDKAYLSRLQNGKVNPASDELNTAIAEITGGDPDALKMAAYYEKAPKEVRESLDKGNYYDRFFDMFLNFGQGELPKELSDEMIEDILEHNSTPLAESAPRMEEYLFNVLKQDPERFSQITESSKRLGMIGVDAKHVLRLRRLREENNIPIEEISEALGITVEQYLTLERVGGLNFNSPNPNPDREELNRAYNRALEVVEKAVEIMNQQETEQEKKYVPYNPKTMIRIPVLNLETGDSDSEFLPTKKIPFGEFVYLITADDSMIGAGINKRAKLFCQVEGEGFRNYKGEVVVQSGKIYAVSYKNEIIIRRVFQPEDSEILFLQSENPKFPPITITDENHGDFKWFGFIKSVEVNLD